MIFYASYPEVGSDRVIGRIIVMFDVLAATGALDYHTFKFYVADKFQGSLVIVKVMQPLAGVFFKQLTEKKFTLVIDHYKRTIARRVGGIDNDDLAVFELW